MSPARQNLHLTASWHGPCSSSPSGLSVIYTERSSLVPKSAHLAVNEFAGLMTKVARSGRPPVPRCYCRSYKAEFRGKLYDRVFRDVLMDANSAGLTRPRCISSTETVATRSLHQVGLYGLRCSCNLVAPCELLHMSGRLAIMQRNRWGLERSGKKSEPSESLPKEGGYTCMSIWTNLST